MRFITRRFIGEYDQNLGKFIRMENASFFFSGVLKSYEKSNWFGLIPVSVEVQSFNAYHWGVLIDWFIAEWNWLSNEN